MGKIIKITKENTSWEELLDNWERCNNERLEEQKLRITYQNNEKYWRNRAGELERIINEERTTKISFETIGELLKGFKCKPNDLFKF